MSKETRFAEDENGRRFPLDEEEGSQTDSVGEGN